MTYNIREAAAMLRVPASTLRYYGKEGLLPFVQRQASGYRVFSDFDISLLRILECLKKTGLSIKELRQFMEWVQQGTDTLEQQHQVFVERREAVARQIAELQELQALIERKCAHYEKAIAEQTDLRKLQLRAEDPLPCDP